MKYTTGEKYDGEWKEDVKEGKGSYESPVEGKYYGDWVNNMKHGLGKRLE